MILFEYVHRGKGALTEWRAGLQTVQQAQLDGKTDLLEVSNRIELLPGLVIGPIRRSRRIYKLQIGAKVRLRPLLCKGPRDKLQELTFLVGATERDFKFDPPRAQETAEARLLEVESDLTKRIPYETPTP